ncbi:M81 family metallopeptidase [Sphingomonas oligophenolica]
MYPAMALADEMFRLEDVNIPVGGFLREMKADDVEIIPSLWAGATPSARVSRETYERIVSAILDAAASGPFDAIYIDLHGAMVTEHLDDGEGELLERLRQLVGQEVRIVASLDLHANVTERMFVHSDGLVAYRTYPHEDMAVTGARAARLLKALLFGPALHRAARRIPFLIPINAMSTLADPARALYDAMSGLETGSIASLSFTMGFPAADFPECGPVVWGYGSDREVVELTVDALYGRIVAGEGNWEQRLLDPHEAVREAQRLARNATRPVIIADTQDNPGGGANSDTTGMLRALLDCEAEGAAIGLMVDSAAAKAAHEAGVGAEITLALGGRSGTPGDAPFEGVFRVEQLSDGCYVFGGRMLTGKVTDVGPSARLSIGGVHIVVSTWKDQMMDRNQYRMVGIDPESMAILVNKSSTHFRADFEQIAEAIIVAKAPGLLLADPADLPWTRLPDDLRLSPLGPSFAEWQKQRSGESDLSDDLSSTGNAGVQ